MLLQAVIFN